MLIPIPKHVGSGRAGAGAHGAEITYLRLTGLRLGLLINFNVMLIRDGITRIVL